MKLIFYENILKQKETSLLFQFLMAQKKEQRGGTGTQNKNFF